MAVCGRGERSDDGDGCMELDHELLLLDWPRRPKDKQRRRPDDPHTTQFAAVGSMMLANNSGSGFLSSGGSYVTYLDQRPAAAVAPKRLSLREGATTPFSLVIEKMDPAKAGCGPHPLRTPTHLGVSLQG